MNPIIVRCANGVVLFLPSQRASFPGLIMTCLNDNTLIVEQSANAAGVKSMLSAMLAKAVALEGAVVQVVQLQLR